LIILHHLENIHQDSTVQFSLYILSSGAEVDNFYGRQSKLNLYVHQELNEIDKTSSPNKSFEDSQNEENLIIQLYPVLLALISLGQYTVDCRLLSFVHLESFSAPGVNNVPI